ncbi:MAG: hypothetical protein NT062_37550, partial [Proteobacteria bacterium]|nr:hypothetical protein [Pseudomonadota bacterium]
TDLDPGLDGIVRKALKKAVDERWSSAAVFRDAIGEWLFEHRHRMTNRHVADVVASLRGAVADRRRKQEDDAHALAVPHDDIPIAIEPGSESSMPVITYEKPLEDKLQRALDAVQPIAPAPSARIVRPELPRPVPAMSVPAIPASIMIPPLRASAAKLPAHPPPPLAHPPAGAFDSIELGEGIDDLSLDDDHSEREHAGHGDHDDGIDVDLSLDGAIVMSEAAESISAAVTAIVLPDVEIDDVMLTIEPSEDSVLRAFDDDNSEPQPRFDLHPPRPSPEDLARKRPPTPPALADIAEPPDDSGDFATTSPLRVLFRLMTARATGLLVVFVGGIKKEIYVRDGQPEYVSSNVASELFGNYLVSKSVLSDGELAMALAMMPHYGGKLGDTLVGLGLLKPLEVFRHLTRQVRTKIIDVCTWNKGQFGWYAGRENPREAFPLDFNAFEILGAGGMSVADDVIEAWAAKHGVEYLRVARSRRVGPERFEVKGLVELCEVLDGRQSISDLIEAQADRFERLRIARMLNLLEACDLARPA